jgi:cytochrome c
MSKAMAAAAFGAVMAATSMLGVSSVQADEALAKKDNCMACHQMDKKVVGPSFKDIAAKYKDDPGARDMLMAKVKAGGSGVWGPIPMPPNAAVSDEDTATLVDWILAL